MTMRVEIVDIANRIASNRINLSARERFSKYISVEIEDACRPLNVQPKCTRPKAG